MTDRYTHTPTSMAVVAWTGGSEPAPLEHVNELERALVLALLESQCAAFRAFWGKEPDAGTRALYLTRARYDAHATMRAGCWTPPAPAPALPQLTDCRGVLYLAGSMLLRRYDAGDCDTCPWPLTDEHRERLALALFDERECTSSDVFPATCDAVLLPDGTRFDIGANLPQAKR